MECLGVYGIPWGVSRIHMRVFSYSYGGPHGFLWIPVGMSMRIPMLRRRVFPNAGSPVVGVVTRVARVAFPLGFRGARRREEAEEEEGEEEGGG